MMKRLEHRIAFENLILGISTQFVRIDLRDTDRTILDALREVGNFVRADRSYVFLVRPHEYPIVDNTHEWCSDGIEPQIDNLQGLDLRDLPWWLAPMERQESIHIPSVRQLPPEADPVRAILEPQGVKSLIVVPMYLRDVFVGFLGFDAVTEERLWTTDELTLLRVLGEIIAGARQRKKSEEALQQSMLHVSQLNHAYRRFVPHEMLRLLGKDSIVAVELGDHVQREFAVLFADIRGFTAMAEALSPREVFEFINSYLAVMVPIVRTHRGYVDKYIGDAILALFPGGADDALAAAVAMQREVSSFNAAPNRSSGKPVQIRIGVHVGSLILGTVGERGRLEGTVISDAVNLTARLENLCERYGVGVITTEAALSKCEAANSQSHRCLGNVTVKGKAEPVRVFEVFAGDTEDSVRLKQRTKQDFERAVATLADGDALGSLVLLQAVTQQNPHDLAARFLMVQAAELLRNRISRPEPA